MIIAKAVFTMIDDKEGEKVTTIIEYGPFPTNDKHVVQALIEYLEQQLEPEDNLPPIIGK